MTASAAKVARDWNNAQMEREIDLFQDYVSTFWGVINGYDHQAKRDINYRWVDMVKSGKKLVPWLVETRAVPPGLAKKFEMAIRLFYSARQSPRNMDSWVKRNQKNIAYFEQALTWPEKASADDGGDEVFRLSGMTVHNTVHLTGKKLDTTKKVIDKAIKELKSSGIPNASGTIYGNLFIVGRLSQPRTLAWYDVNADELYLRPHLRYGSSEIHNLVHEIGHRYWHKLMGAGKKREFAKYHQRVKWMKSKGIEMPVIGEPLPIPVRGHKTPPIVLADKNGFYEIEGGGRVKKMQVIKMLQRAAKDANFPTPYAATSVGEHFAEAFAMFAIGDLEPHHREAFEAIVVNGEQPQEAPVKTEKIPPPPPPPRPEPEPEPTPEPDSGLPDRLPSGRALFTMVKELEKMARARRTKKVLAFVEGVRETLEGGGRLGPKREKRLTRILQSYGLMQGESSRRVAARFLGEL
jgi:hypothetical protein